MGIPRAGQHSRVQDDKRGVGVHAFRKRDGIFKVLVPYCPPVLNLGMTLDIWTSGVTAVSLRYTARHENCGIGGKGGCSPVSPPSKANAARWPALP